jgi:hypothetical protein
VLTIARQTEQGVQFAGREKENALTCSYNRGRSQFCFDDLRPTEGQGDPPISQQHDLLGIPNALEVFGELSGKLDDAYNNKDAGAAAALFTEDAALVTSDGMIFGRQAIEKRYADTFQRWPITGFLSRRERLKLNAIDNAVWSVGEWSELFKVRPNQS